MMRGNGLGYRVDSGGAAAQEELQGALSNRFHGGRCQGAGSDERGSRQAEQPFHHVTDWRG